MAARFVHLSYAVSSAYVLSHAVAQGLSTRNRLNNIDTKEELNNSRTTLSGITTTHTDLHNCSCSSNNHHSFNSLSQTEGQKHSHPQCSNSTTPVSPSVAMLDTLVWQGLASVVIPGLAINRLCAGSRILLSRYATRVLSQQVRRWTVVGIGLSSIPIIIHPIDW